MPQKLANNADRDFFFLGERVGCSTFAASTATAHPGLQGEDSLSTTVPQPRPQPGLHAPFSHWSDASEKAGEPNTPSTQGHGHYLLLPP